VEEAPYSDPKPAEYPYLIHLPIVVSGLFARKEFYKNGNIHHIRFENIQVFVDEGVPQPQLAFAGVDAAHIVSDVEIVGLFVNGERITDPAVLTVGDFAYNITLK
jgi:hypothetical protein